MSQQGRHHAILIGSSQFSSDSGFKPLRCPENDVDGMQQLLTSPEFGLFHADNLLIFKNRPHYEILRAINPVFRLADPQDLILLYYSGHGELDKKDHLHLATPDSNKEDIETTSIPAERIRRLIDNHRCKRIVLILDCCYSGAIKHDLLRSTADSEMKLLAKGIYVLTASTAMETAEEKEGDEYGLLTKHILDGVKSGQAAGNVDGLISVDALYQHVSRAVARNSAQTPTCYGLDEQGGHLYIARAAALYTAEKMRSFRDVIFGIEDDIDDEVFADSIRVIKQNQPKRDKQFFQLLDKLLAGDLRPAKFSSQWYKLAFGTSSASSQAVEATKPAPKPTAEARQQPAKTAPAQTQPPVKPPESTTKKVAANGFTDDLNGVPLEMLYVPGGTFKMGTPKGSGHDDERPQHDVTVPAFYMGKFQITQAQWKAVMEDNPSHFKGDDLPVETVSWEEAEEFCQKLQQISQKHYSYRLPSEAEWEYACRAGTTGDYAGKLDEMAWYDKNSGSKTHPVGQKKPNAYGLYDMHGNVWEWCEDVWHDDYKGSPVDGSAWTEGGNQDRRVVRGGSWNSNGNNCRSTYRYIIEPALHNYIIGFRVVVSARTS